MYEKQTKKMLIMNILNILKNHSDGEHRLSQKDIIDYLRSDYDMDVERKAVIRNINNLIDEGYDINYSEIERGKGKNKNVMQTDFYLIRDFEDAELRLLIDGLIFSKYIPYSQCKELIKKLENLSNEYFKSRTKYIQLLKNDMPTNRELFYTIDVIDEAISKGKKVEFNYCNYDINKKLVAKKGDNGKDRFYRVSPYNIVATSGRYYLLGVYEGYEEIANIRLDRIKNIKLTNEKLVPNESPIKNLSKHMMEQIYMHSGDAVKVTFEFPDRLFNDVIDWFGRDIDFKDKGKGTIEAKCEVNPYAMKYWALQYGDYVKVTSPKSLIDEIKYSIKTLQKTYS